jgi:hypothetical protein
METSQFQKSLDVFDFFGLFRPKIQTKQNPCLDGDFRHPMMASTEGYVCGIPELKSGLIDSGFTIHVS